MRDSEPSQVVWRSACRVVRDRLSGAAVDSEREDVTASVMSRDIERPVGYVGPVGLHLCHEETVLLMQGSCCHPSSGRHDD